MSSLKKISSFLRNHWLEYAKNPIWIGLFVFGLMEFIHMIYSVFINPNAGWDFQIYCRAYEAMEQGKNPYFVENLRTTLSFTYPHLSAYLFSPACVISDKAYIFVQVLLFGLCLILLSKKLSLNFFRTFLVLAFSFHAFRANLNSGNLGLLEGLAFVLMLVSFDAEKSIQLQNWGSIGMGLVAYIKLLPVVLLISPVIYRFIVFLTEQGRSWIGFFKKILPQIYAVMFILLLWIMTWINSSDYAKSFFLQLTGKLNGQHSAIAESQANPNNPTIMLLIRNLNDSLSPGSNGYVLAGVFFLLIISGFVWKSKVLSDKTTEVEKLCWIAWTLILFLPRYKEYSYFYSAILMAILLEYGFRQLWTPVFLILVLCRQLAGTYDGGWQALVLGNIQTLLHFALFVWLGVFNGCLCRTSMLAFSGEKGNRVK